jgi:hypothetical protein
VEGIYNVIYFKKGNKIDCSNCRGISLLPTTYKILSYSLISRLTQYVKGKFVPVLTLFNWAPYHEGVLWEWMYSSTHSLTSALDGGEWSASRPCRFTPRERTSDTYWIGGWVGPRAVLEAVVKRKIPSPCQESKPRTPIVQSLAQRCVDEIIGDHQCGFWRNRSATDQMFCIRQMLEKSW